MLKRSITFDDFEGNSVTEVHYFNLNKLEAGKLVHFEDIENKILKATASEDAQQAFELFETIILRCYGIKEDNTIFIKSEEATNRFRQSLAFEALVMELLENPDLGAQFIEQVLPQKLVQEAKKNPPINAGEATVSPIRKVQDTPPLEQYTPPAEPEPESDDRPLYMRELRLPTDKEIREMDKAQLAEAMKWKNQLGGN